MKQYAATFARIEQEYGVPAPVIVAIWGLETDFGAVSGNTPTLRALATLAYDCRRSDMFQAELMDAAARSARRPVVQRARRLGRRSRPDPIHAFVLY